MPLPWGTGSRCWRRGDSVACRRSRWRVRKRSSSQPSRSNQRGNGPRMRPLPNTTAEVTGLLLKWGQGNDSALERLIPLVYDELHRIARKHIGHEAIGHSLQPTALVNEAYLRLVAVHNVAWQDRTHFLAVSARIMRRILV